MSKKTVAQVIVETLSASGVQRVYGIAGDSLTPITEVIRQHPDIRWMPVRHEETAAFAAGAESHLTGELTVCAGSCGRGNLHLINGLYDCQRSRVPVLAIASHIPSREVGSGYFQETHPENLFKECSVFCEQLSHPQQLPHLLAIAMRTAVEQRGVAVLVISGDVSAGECLAAPFVGSLAPARPVIRPADEELAEAANWLNQAKKITILGGAGCQGAHDDLIALAKILQAPIVHALRGKEFIEYDNPFDVGMTGLLGFSSGYHAMMACEVLLMLGTDFPYRQFYPPHAKIIQVDIRGQQIGKRTHVDLGLVGDVGATVRVLLPLLKTKTEHKHLDTALAHYRQSRQGLDDLATGTIGHMPIHPQYLAKVINDTATSDAIFTCDVGTPTIWAARYLTMNGQRRLLGSFAHGSMASALPQAIGAQATFPQRQIITLSGDGGLAMLLGDLLTLRQLKLPIKIIVFNNSSLGFVELEMKGAGVLDFATDLDNPSFAKIAEASGLLGLRVEQPEELAPKMAQIFNHVQPALLEVVVNRQELILPPSLTREQVVGFNLFMAKAVLSGRGDEVIDLAKTNLWR